MLNIRDRQAVVVGGGPVGARKARSLLEAGAKVRLAARQTNPQLHQLQQVGLDLRIEDYRPQLLEGAFLVFACTDDHDLNALIARDARQAGALVNAADQPEDCDFYLPSVVRRDDVVVAVGTDGSAPALAANLRERLTAALPERIGEFASVLKQIREELKAELGDTARRGEVMKELSRDSVYQAFTLEGAGAVRRRMTELLGEF